MSEMQPQNTSDRRLSPHGETAPHVGGQITRRSSGAISVIIPTLNAADSLPATLQALTADRPSGLQLEILVSDGGSGDQTQAIATAAEVTVITASRGRGQQLAAGADQAQFDWLLFLHADTVLTRGWDSAIAAFILHPRSPEKAAVFQFRLNDSSAAARRLEKWVRWRSNLLALPYGDQGLLIHRQLYAEIGGYREIVLMEDVDIIRRLGRSRLIRFDVDAVTDAGRYLRAGYGRRMLRNGLCLLLYFLGLPPHLIKRLYG